MGAMHSGAEVETPGNDYRPGGLPNYLRDSKAWRTVCAKKTGGMQWLGRCPARRSVFITTPMW